MSPAELFRKLIADGETPATAAATVDAALMDFEAWAEIHSRRPQIHNSETAAMDADLAAIRSGNGPAVHVDTFFDDDAPQPWRPWGTGL